MPRNFTDQITVNGWQNLMSALVSAGYTGVDNPAGETTILNFQATPCYIHFSDDAATAPNIAGTAQVESTTLVAASGCTGNGNLIMTITGAGITGSPVNVTVALTTALNTAAKVAGAVRTALAANAAISAVYTVGGTGADISLTQITRNGNDGTLNIDINADDAGTTATGITNDATSDNTTAGVHAGLGGFPIATDTAAAPSSAFTLPRGTNLSNVWLYTGSSIVVKVGVIGG